MALSQVSAHGDLPAYNRALLHEWEISANLSGMTSKCLFSCSCVLLLDFPEDIKRCALSWHGSYIWLSRVRFCDRTSPHHLYAAFATSWGHVCPVNPIIVEEQDRVKWGDHLACEIRYPTLSTFLCAWRSTHGISPDRWCDEWLSVWSAKYHVRDGVYNSYGAPESWALND